ncbi:ABC transporter substrate-binding protein [Alteromonas oceanisediminis]|uniref:ABC transporter substrate-binding protein n=1 Tax=Alteromonas oceanisediminis TaxID=2836180 RepID=UPI001BD93280|nr:ABC transporter substrate-binding protein [Alteromonas oceanisediminis]MBT0584875.1 ABC transporter substrate-binding protein [Alteromonas oceanisediminis]
MKRSAWRPTTAFFVAVLGACLAGCSPTETSQPSTRGVVYCSESDPTSFNPQLDTSGTTSDASAHQLYDRLIEFDIETGNIVAGLAESWLVSEDGLVYTFQLKKNVAFHHTDYFSPSRTFNADDVLFSINRWRDESHPYHTISGGMYPYFQSLNLAANIESVDRINGYRIQIHLTKPDSSFLAHLATDFAVILSAEYADELLKQGRPEALDHYPIGTGPYRFVEYRKNRFIRYERHDNYWRHSVPNPQLVFDITQRSALRLAKLITGECDVSAFPAQSELNAVREDDRLTLLEKPGLNVGFWAFNTQREPFDNPDVRRALAMAIDKSTLLDAVYFGSAKRAIGIVPPTSWAHQQNAEEISYNPVQSRSLLRAMGVEQGFSMTIWAMPVQRAYNPNAMKMAKLMQGYLAAVGVEVTIVSYDWTTFRNNLQAGMHDSVLIGWSADNADPDNFYRPLLTCGAIPSGTNRAMWCNQKYDNLIERAIAVTDSDQRKQLYAQANRLLYEQVPLLPIAHAFRYQAQRENIKKVIINSYGGIQLGEVEKRDD